MQRRVEDVTLGEVHRRFETHEEQAAERFKAIEEKLNALGDIEAGHDKILHEVAGGIKVLKFIGWVFTGGIVVSIIGFWRKLSSMFGA